jgi:hypothetical protein
LSDAARTLERLAAYLRAHGVDAWASYIEALPPDGEEAQAFARSQAEIGHPDPFQPRTERGRFMRKILADAEPSELGLRVLVSLEGLAEPLAAGAYFPMPPTPVRGDGLPLWSVKVEVLTDDPLVPRVSHPRVESIPSYSGGFVLLLIWGESEGEARAIADGLVTAAGRRRITVEPAPGDALDPQRVPRSPADYESRLVATRWQRCQPSDAGVKIAWFTGLPPLERVDVEETGERVTITLWERHPPAFSEGGAPRFVLAIGYIRCVEVPLRAPLGDRELIDGSTGRHPDDLDPFDAPGRSTHAELRALDIDALDCDPAPVDRS